MAQRLWFLYEVQRGLLADLSLRCYPVAMTDASATNPAVIQGDRSILLEVAHPEYDRAREILARFAELEKAPEHVHTYRVSHLALWNAAAAGLDGETVLRGLKSISRYAFPSHLDHEIRDIMGRYGVCVIDEDPADASRLRLSVRDSFVQERIVHDASCAALLQITSGEIYLSRAHRGRIKQAVLKIGYPVEDRALMFDGQPFAIALQHDRFKPYPYQQKAIEAFASSGSHGTIVLPCGAGKTIVALLAMARLSTRTLVITSGREACTQWKREMLRKTSLRDEDVCVYRSGHPDVGPVTVTTYSMLGRKGGKGPTGYSHFDRLTSEPWGLIVYDEVHLLPAPVFRLTAELQARRRLGLTATLVREDGREGDVFALIGPKRYDVPWRELETSGHIAAATCFEVRVRLPEALRFGYATAETREQPRIAAENPAKLKVAEELVGRHVGDRVLVVGTYLHSLQDTARRLSAPIITGETGHAERERLYAEFRTGAIRTLVLSKVGNFAIDLPDANVLIQVSGSMGSRQEEAQRLGRILRPKPGGAFFYSVVTEDTVEQEMALHRQTFLTEQGYRYIIEQSADEDESLENHSEDTRGPTIH